MIDADRLELVDTGDGVPLTKCAQNLYEALANMQDLRLTDREDSFEERLFTMGMELWRLEDALTDMSELVAEVKRLQSLMQEVGQ